MVRDEALAYQAQRRVSSHLVFKLVTMTNNCLSITSILKLKVMTCFLFYSDQVVQHASIGVAVGVPESGS